MIKTNQITPENTKARTSDRAFTPLRQAKRQATKVTAAIRTFIAMSCFVLTVFISAGADLDLAFAKKAAKRAVSRMREVKSKGQFRLLNIYKTLSATHPKMVDSMNHATKGLASWYGGMFHGRSTAMGTKYNMYAMTAAHRTLPLGTWVSVTNAANGKSLVVQVTDRGPYVANRIMDLSYAAAQKLGYANNGTTHIAMKVLGRGYASAEAAMAASDATAMAQPTSDSTTVAGKTFAFAGVSTRTDNVAIGNAGTQSAGLGDFSSLIQAITSLTSASPVHAVANMFA